GKRLRVELLLSAAALLGDADADADAPAALPVAEAAPPTRTDPAATEAGTTLGSLGGPSTPWPTALVGLVEADLLAEVPADVAELLRLLPSADLYVQDEIDVRLHPTVTRVWSRQGRRGQRRRRGPRARPKTVGPGAPACGAG